MNNKYPVITLCGSTRFKDAFFEAQKKLTLEGNIVISVGVFGHSENDEGWEDMDEKTIRETKAMIDDMHKAKIDMSDSVYIINVDGYIGDSTRSDIEYAQKQGKRIVYLCPMEEDDVFDEWDDEEIAVYDKKVQLDLIVDALRMMEREQNYYYDVANKEITVFSKVPDESEDLDEEERFPVEERDHRLIPMPDYEEIDIVNMMKDFINEEVTDEEIRDKMWEAMANKGAVRRFRNLVEYNDLDDQWHQFKEDIYRRIAVRWCENNGFEYK